LPLIFPPNATSPSLKLKPAKSLPATTVGFNPFFELPVPLVGVDLTALVEPLSASVFLSSAAASVLVEPALEDPEPSLELPELELLVDPPVELDDPEPDPEPAVELEDPELDPPVELDDPEPDPEPVVELEDPELEVDDPLVDPPPTGC
jgi:hypothetical protein